MSKNGWTFFPRFPGGKEYDLNISKISPHFFQKSSTTNKQKPISHQYLSTPFLTVFWRKKRTAFSEQSPTWKGRPMTSNSGGWFGWFGGVTMGSGGNPQPSFCRDLCSQLVGQLGTHIFRASKSTCFMAFWGPKGTPTHKNWTNYGGRFQLQHDPMWNNMFVRKFGETSSRIVFLVWDITRHLKPPCTILWLRKIWCPPTQEHITQQHPRTGFSFSHAKLHLPKRPSRKLYLDLVLAEQTRWAPNGLIIGVFLWWL